MNPKRKKNSNPDLEGKLRYLNMNMDRISIYFVRTLQVSSTNMLLQVPSEV